MSTILIVDDNDWFRDMLGAVMQARGFKILAAASAGEGLELAAAHALEAIVSDYQMPHVDGLTFCRALRSQNTRLDRNVPLWIMTGSLVLADHEAVAAGAEGVFRKPFFAIDLAKTIARYLAREDVGVKVAP